MNVSGGAKLPDSVDGALEVQSQVGELRTIIILTVLQAPLVFDIGGANPQRLFLSCLPGANAQKDPFVAVLQDVRTGQRTVMPYTQVHQDGERFLEKANEVIAKYLSLN